jgi:hypothetical protein
MVLSTEARGMVERYIDTMLATVPLLVQYFNLKTNQDHLQYKEPDDVVFGYVWGAISAAILPMLLPFGLQQNTPVEDVFEEIRRMLEMRSAEIHDRIALEREAIRGRS